VRIYQPIKKKIIEEPEKSKKTKKNSTEPQVSPKLDYEMENATEHFLKVIEPIANKWNDLNDFTKILKSKGLNIFPEPDSEKFVTITNKVKNIKSF
jgi:ATP adenylyltransferase/5',5'''-P-1,P-4-tetraphosphate phosphorylase II